MPKKTYRWCKEQQRLIDITPPDPIINTERYLKGEYLNQLSDGYKGDIKYANNRERIKHIMKQAWVDKGCKSSDIKHWAKDAHYFPKTNAEYMKMAGFDGRKSN